MIPYHGTPIGGRIEESARFLHGRHALVAFLHRQHLKEVMAYTKSFVLDNSAFSAWRKGITIDFKEYAEWVRGIHKHPGFDWALIPDIIDGDEEANDRLLAEWPDDILGVPVWHLHESLDRLHRLTQDYRIVALGSSGEYKSPSSRKWWARMHEVMDEICDDEGRPPCKLHGLRMMNPAVFTRLPLSSVDSTQVAINGGKMSEKNFGRYLPPSTFVRSCVLADRIEHFQSAPVWERKVEQVQVPVSEALPQQPDNDQLPANDQVFGYHNG